VPVAAAVKVASPETIAGAPPQKRKSLFCELGEEVRKVRNDQRIEWARWRRRRDGRDPRSRDLRGDSR
jgi:hypothetical protein